MYVIVQSNRLMLDDVVLGLFSDDVSTADGTLADNACNNEMLCVGVSIFM